MRPEAVALLRALAATWPPVRAWEADGWTLRDGGGGGKRVSAATAVAGAQVGPEAPSLVMVRPGEAALDRGLAAAAYRVLDPTRLYLAPAEQLAGPLPRASVWWAAERLGIMEQIWAECGIGPARLAVMDRVEGPTAALLARCGDRAAGTGFVAVADGLAMVHAVEVLPRFRRQGAATLMLRCAACWALARGADRLALAVTEANAPAIALYERLGMRHAASYHYRERRRT